MQPLADTIPAPPTPAVSCAVAAFGLLETCAGELPGLRQRLAKVWESTLSASLLRQADEQSIVALAALTAAREQLSAEDATGPAWAVLTAPRFIGRAAHAAALERMRIDGPWGVSPQFVAHRSLHSVPGLLSLALRSHGLNLGVGGAPGAEAEVLLTASVYLHAERVPGIWVVLTGWQPEPIPSPLGEIPPESVCRGVALALTPVAAASTGFRLRIVCRRPEHEGCAFLPANMPASFTLEALQAALNCPPEYCTTWIWYMEHGLLELTWPGRRREKHR